MMFNLNKALSSGLLLLGAIVLEPNLAAQPSSIAGDALVVQVTSATGSFSVPAFYLLLPDNSGSGYQSIDISGVASSSGTYSYAFPNLQLNDSAYGPESLAFDSANVTGSFTLSNNVSQQSGNVILATGPAMPSLADHSYYLNILAGSAPFVSQGSVIFTTASTGNDYTVIPTSSGISAASGTYQYFVANKSTGAFTVNDSASGAGYEYFAFTSSTGGYYLVTHSSGGYQIGTFSVANMIPSQFFMGQVDLANHVDWLQFSDGTPFGYYNVMDFNFPLFYHFDLGFEWYFDANNSAHGCYLYDFASKTFFYTDPATFPYLYDFTLNAWLYYYPDSSAPGRYTSNPRYFYDFGSQQVITK